VTPEDEPRDRRHPGADRAGWPSADGRELAGVVAPRGDDRRSTRRILLAAVGCVLLLGITLPWLVDGDPREHGPASGPVASTRQGAAAPIDRTADFFRLPTRGSLAGDQGFLDGVRALPWSDEPPVRAADGTILYYLPDPPAAERTVVFAGDVPGGRWALVAGWTTSLPPDAAHVPQDVVPDDALVAAWFTGPPGASAEQMTLASGPNGIRGDWPAALTNPRNGVIVVVTAPGDVVEVSQRPLVDAAGRTTREWRKVDTEDGIAIARVSPFPRVSDGSTSYRVLRGGRIEARDAPWSIYAAERAAELPIEFPRGRPSELGVQAAEYAAATVLGELGLSPAQAQITAQWVGPVPPGEVGEAAVVTVTLPSDAIVVQAQWLMPADAGGSDLGTYCGQAILPAGPPAERRVQAVACEVIDSRTGAPMSTYLVVVGPPEVALIRAYDDDRTFLAEHQAQDGVLVVPLPLGTKTVEAVTDGGVTLGRVDLLGHAADFGD
jgi:hypothetical protein